MKTIAQTQLKENIDSKFSNLNLKTNRSSKNKNSCKLLCENSFHPLDTEKIEKATLEKKLKDKKKSVFIPDYDTFFKKDGINGINDLCLTKNIISTSKTPMFAYKLYKTISKFYIVEKFIKNLRNATNIRIPTSHQLNRMHILNDLSFFKEGFDLKNTETINKYMCVRLKIFILINGIFSFFIKCLLKFYHLFIMICCRFIIVFDPASTLRAIWDVLHLFVLCFYFFKIPVELSFEINIFEEIGKIHHNFSKILECFGTLFLLIDILVNFNTGYYKKGCLIYSQKNIAKHYIKSKFFFDIISFIPILLEYQKFSFDEKWMFLFVFRVSNFFKIFSRIEESIHINFKLFNLLSLLKVLARIVLLSHLFACGWHYISLTNISHSSETWLFLHKNIY